MGAIKQARARAVTEFGDFQTPPILALAATTILYRLGIRPRSILEPTCGRGAFVASAAATFHGAESIVGIDINQEHLRSTEILGDQPDHRIKLQQGDFFKVDWKAIVTETGAPWLILGNPPWVTSADLGAIESDNLPEKSNFHGRNGIEAITGKSNFDISEWMLLRYLDWLEGTAGTIAVLCKSTVARKILLQIWKNNKPLRSARIYKIDALGHFGAAVDACFFVLDIEPEARARACDIYESLAAERPSHTFGFLDGHIIRDVAAFKKHRDLLGPETSYEWRSGIKHDCSKVMELAPTPDGFQNGLGETVTLEDDFLFPLLKSSDIGNGRIHSRGVMLVTQTFVGEDTTHIKIKAPKTWDYLTRHADLLDKRGSVIYKNKPAFSIFGVGPYTFAPWKVAISGFYKRLHFVKTGPIDDKPAVFDDTIYFTPCWSEEEACFVESLLRSEAAEAFLNSMIHWDEKRPITVEILKRLSFRKLAALLGREQEYFRFTEAKDLPLLAL
jgi:methylase of polypeptide subunit release factors